MDCCWFFYKDCSKKFVYCLLIVLLYLRHQHCHAKQVQSRFYVDDVWRELDVTKQLEGWLGEMMAMKRREGMELMEATLLRRE